MAMLYIEGARILDTIENKKGTVKSLCLSSRVQNKKQLYALVCETLKYRKILQQIIESARLLNKENCLTLHIAQVLVYDFLFGRGINVAQKKFKDAVLKHKSALKAELARLKVKARVTQNKDLLSGNVKSEVALPRYVRVNTIKTTVQDVIDHFTREDYTLIRTQGLHYDRFIELVMQLQPRHFVVDLDIPELLVFAPKTDLHDHILYTSGDIILQDKASCIPAHVLAPPPGSHVIDCCAAPGNKTTHAASLLNNHGKIFSFDLDSRRLATMATLTLRAGVLCCTQINQDFLTVDKNDPRYAKVTHAIVDPSCSGSGIVSRMNMLTDDEESNSSTRLQKLSTFQQSILEHVLSFPAIQRVVYSTCSVHAVENETVVEKVLQKHSDQFCLKPVLENMPGRGIGKFRGSTYCLRTDPSRDLTNGFFVACFEKLSPKENKGCETVVCESKDKVETEVKDNIDKNGIDDMEEYPSQKPNVDLKQLGSQDKCEMKKKSEVEEKKHYEVLQGDSTSIKIAKEDDDPSSVKNIEGKDFSKHKIKKKRNRKKKNRGAVNSGENNVVADSVQSLPVKRPVEYETPSSELVKKRKMSDVGKATGKNKKQKRKKRHRPVTT